jgi:hypothetical protein
MSRRVVEVYTPDGPVRMEPGVVLTQWMVDALGMLMVELERLRGERDALGTDYYRLLLSKRRGP